MTPFIQHKSLRLTCLLILGACCVLGFAPFYQYAASILSVAGLCFFWQKSISPREAAVDGFVYGLGLFGTGIYWIYISLHDFGGMPSFMAGLSTFLLAAFMALFTGAIGALSKQLARDNKKVMLIAIPLIWALSDWSRSWIFTGFPWLSMGYSQIPNSPVAGYLPIIGIYGVSVISVWVASLVAYWFTVTPDHQTVKKRYVFISILSIILTGALLKQISWTKAAGVPTTVSLLQGNIPQDIKWDPDTAAQTMLQYTHMAEQSSAKLIIMPETALPVIASELPAEIKSRLLQHAVKNDSDILIGMVEREQGEYFNSVLNIGVSQNSAYRKSHLVPFGEFIPFKTIFGWIYRDWLNMPLSDLSRGNKHQSPMQVAGEKVAINICYEDVFGEEIIRQLPAATLLVNVSNDAWYGNSFAADQHMQFSQARAMETGRMMLRATNTGATAIISNQGKIIAHAPHFKQTTLDGTAQGYTGMTPYILWGNWPIVTFCLCLIVFLWRRNRSVHIQNL
ncbi:MAG: apolipoprotein N-acyltransferase [Methylotenera sp.]|nr:apolipoprotein N-acyltransferase [Methylotenera sp.]